MKPGFNHLSQALDSRFQNRNNSFNPVKLRKGNANPNLVGEILEKN
jgi:hypothetical protein